MSRRNVAEAVDALIMELARAAVSVIGGGLLGLYLIGAVWGGS